MTHPDYPSGFLDYSGEISISEGLSLYGLNHISGSSSLRLESAIASRPDCIPYWKEFIDSSHGSENSCVLYVVSQAKTAFGSLSKKQKLQIAIPYVHAVLSSSKFFKKCTSSTLEGYEKWVMPFAGIDTRKHEEILPAFVQMCSGELLAVSKFRSISDAYSKKWPENYFFNYCFANSFRYGDSTTNTDSPRFRSESQKLSVKFAIRPTPHFTIAMTSADRNIGLKEAQSYLRLEKRPTKDGWKKKLVEKYPELKK